MARIKLIDKVFETSITETQIQEHVKAVADRINKDMADKNPLLLAVLNGSFMFAADLMRMLTIPCEISFVKAGILPRHYIYGKNQRGDWHQRRPCRTNGYHR